MHNVEKNVKDDLFEVVNMVTGMDVEELDPDSDLFSFGLDSLSLMALGKQISKKFNVEISLEELATKYNTLNLMAEYLTEKTSIGLTTEPSSDINVIEKNKEDISTVPLQKNDIENDIENASEIALSDENLGVISRIFNKQLNIINEQTALLGQYLNKSIGAESQVSFTHNKVEMKPSLKTTKNIKASGENYYVPYKKLDTQEKTTVTADQRQYISTIEGPYIDMTKSSKDVTSKYRKIHAEWRNASTFSKLYKEFTYPIYAKSGKKSRIVDIDDNEYIDIAMGFGVNLFGNNPDFVQEALRNAMLENGTPLGPLDKLSCDVAGKISELTGAERVFFANTGTEADMFAVRIARAVTGKNKVVCFKGSYHGSYDGLLGISFWNSEGEVSTIPMAPGIIDSSVKDLILLDYDSDRSLQYIKTHADQIAAVLVEPVQSRRPDIQPKEFLKKLRDITEASNIALIFDEVVLGFRVAAGGAQEYFGIKADITTYGKILGGGLPIGVIAGCSRFLDSIDGGAWNYGDDSVPVQSATRTFVGGTFCHNHYTISAANAVLDYILANKDTMYDELNNKTEYMVNEIEKILLKENVPIKISHFASMFRFHLTTDEDIFYYRLIQKGIYTWEGRTCFLSTEHDDEDVNKIISAVRDTIIEMKEAGFFNSSDKKNINSSIEDTKKEYPMSLIQQRLYSQIMVSEQDPFDMVGVFEVQGSVDEAKLEIAMNQVIEKNEILRTSLHISDGQFIQRINANKGLKIRKINQDAPDLNAFINKSLCKFKLDESPLLEVLLITKIDNKKVLVFHIHHAISDGISIEFIVRELLMAYGGIELSNLRPYSEYLKWEEEYLTSDKLEEDRGFWESEMNGVTSYIPIIRSNSGTNETDRLGKVLYHYLDRNEADKLKKIAKDNGVSMFMLMIGILDIVLHKLTGEDSIAIATSASLRFASGFEDSLGMFANNIAIKSEYSNTTLKDYLTSIKTTTVKAFPHSCYPYNLLVKQVQDQGEDEFNISFSYEKSDGRTPKMNGVNFIPISFMPEMQDYEITFDLQEKNGGIEINFSYIKDMYNEYDMDNLLKRYLFVAHQIIENQDIVLDDLNIVLPTEKEYLLKEFNNTSMPLDRELTVVSMFESQVKKTPDAIALRENDREYTYKELNEKANQVAWFLKDYGIGKDDAVCIMALRSAETIICIHGILKAGAAYMPIDTRYPDDRIIFMIEDCKPKLIFTGEMKVPSGIDVPSISIRDERLYAGKKDNLEVNIPGDSIVHYMYTSGTTGRPKGVRSTHIGLLNRIIWHQKHYPMTNGDSILQKTIYTFDDSVYEILWSTMVGGTLCLLEPEAEMDVAKICEATIKYKITHILFVPTVLREFLRHVEENDLGVEISQLKMIVSAGEPLTPDLVAQFKRILGDTNCVLANLYGPTEASIDVTYYDCNLTETDDVPIGRPIGNMNVYILRGMDLCGIGMQGELCIGGIGVALGYLNRPELTAEKFIKNPFGEGLLYRTGDIAYVDSNGYIRFCGRKDDQVKIRGQRIELGEIEEKIRNLSDINNAVVIAREDANHTKSMYAYMTSDKQLDFKTIRNLLSVDLPNYMIPQYMMQIDSIPLTNNGKINKRALPEIKGQSQIEYVAPQNEIQEVVCKVLEEVLEIDRVGIEDSFFALGGDSIRAIKVVSKLRERGYDLAVRDIFSRETVASLASVVRLVNETEEAEGEIFPVPMINLANKECCVIQIPIGDADEKTMTRAFERLLEVHDILRSTLENDILTVLPKERIVPDVKVFDLKDKDDPYTFMTNEIASLKETFNFEKGPRVKAQFYITSTENYIVLCIDRNIVDDYSLAILKEDIESLVELIDNGSDQSIDTKTASFRSFSAKLNEYLSGVEYESDSEQWETIKSQISESKLNVVCDNAIEKTGNISFSLSSQDTDLLIESAVKAFNTDTSELIISALSIACFKLTGQDKISIDTVDFGRNAFVSCDYERTVGNFACIYPICIEQYDSMDNMIIRTKEMARRLPRVKCASMLKLDNVHPDILLDCLPILRSGFDLSELSFKTGYTLEIKMSIKNKMLTTDILFDTGKISENNARSLGQIFEESLKELIDYCSSRNEQVKTASDYSNEELHDDELNEILGMFE